MVKTPREACHGIACPRCGYRVLRTTHTEPLADNRIRRRKVCRRCGRKVVTFEAPPSKARR